MTLKKYVASIESIIAEQQQVQRCTPPDSAQWQTASEEIRRLVQFIVEVEGDEPEEEENEWEWALNDE